MMLQRPVTIADLDLMSTRNQSTRGLTYCGFGHITSTNQKLEFGLLVKTMFARVFFWISDLPYLSPKEHGGGSSY